MPQPLSSCVTDTDLTHSKQYLAERFQASDDGIEDRLRYNIAPTQPVLTVRKEQGNKIRHFTTMRWGLIPSWAKDMTVSAIAFRHNLRLSSTPAHAQPRGIRTYRREPLVFHGVPPLETSLE